MSDAPLASAVGSADLLQVIQSGGIVLATAGQLWAIPMAQCSSLGEAISALTTRVTALEGRLAPVVLTGSIPVATVQVGSTDLAVPVAGLLRTDTLSGIEIEVDLPLNLDLRSWRPDRTRDGYLIVQATASLAAVAITPAVPIRVTVSR